MDYETLLFELKPLLDIEQLKVANIDESNVQVYTSALEKCSQGARIESNRTIIGRSGLLDSLTESLAFLLEQEFTVDTQSNKNILLIISEIVRVLANSFADNDDNRNIFFDKNRFLANPIIETYFAKVLALNLQQNDPDVIITLQMRLAAMVKNLIVDNRNYVNHYAAFLCPTSYLRLDSINLTSENEVQMALFIAELIDAILEFDQKGATLDEMKIVSTLYYQLSTYITSASVEIDDGDDEEPLIELLATLTNIAEIVFSIDGTFNFDKQQETKDIIQKNILQTIDNLEELKFHNKLIIMRRLVTTSGYIASDKSNTTHSEMNMCLNHLRYENPSPYTIGAIFINITNAIRSTEEAKKLEQTLSIPDIICYSKKLSDPVQFQGVLDLLKKVLNLCNTLLLPDDSLQGIANLLTYSNEQAQYFQGLIPLVNGLLNKLLTVIPSSKIEFIFQGNISEGFVKLICKNGSISASLALDKLLLVKNPIKKDITDRLWECLFHFDQVAKENNTSESANVYLLFQVAKTLGVYLRNTIDKPTEIQDFLLYQYEDQLVFLLSQILDLRDKNVRGSESAMNNGKFVAGLIIDAKKSVRTTDDDRLLAICKQFF